jgi:hypothetical protein
MRLVLELSVADIVELFVSISFSPGKPGEDRGEGSFLLDCAKKEKVRPSP